MDIKIYEYKCGITQVTWEELYVAAEYGFCSSESGAFMDVNEVITDINDVGQDRPLSNAEQRIWAICSVAKFQGFDILHVYK